MLAAITIMTSCNVYNETHSAEQVFINGVGRGTVSGFTRNRIGANSHHLTLQETGEEYILKVREVSLSLSLSL